MRILSRILALLLIPFAGHAQTIASYVGTAPSGVVNTTIMAGTPLVTASPVTLLYNASAPVLAGAQYVTIKQGAAPVGITTYTTTFTSIAGSTGSLQVMCDDTCVVSLNGAVVGSVTAYNTIKSFPITAAATNTLSIAVTNVTGNTGVAFAAKLAPAVIATYSITGNATLSIMSDGTFTISGSGLQAAKK